MVIVKKKSNNQQSVSKHAATQSPYVYISGAYDVDGILPIKEERAVPCCCMMLEG
jgi:hypothetical protein